MDRPDSRTAFLDLDGETLRSTPTDTRGEHRRRDLPRRARLPADRPSQGSRRPARWHAQFGMRPAAERRRVLATRVDQTGSDGAGRTRTPV